MNGKNHFLINICVGIPFWIFVALIPQLSFDATILDIPAIFFAFVASFAWCDLDQHLTKIKIFKFIEHRSVYTHNIFPAVIFAILWNQAATIIFCFFVTLHLLADSIKDKSKQVGYWCIHDGKKRWSGKQSYTYLTVNILIGFVVIIIMLVI